MSFKVALLTSIFIPSIALYPHSVIESISTWTDIEKHVTLDKTTYLFTDLDDTLLRPIEHIGSTKWFVEKWNEYKSMGHQDHKALQTAISDLGEVYKTIDFRLMESHLCDLLQELRERNIIIHGLTARSLHLSDITHKHCKQVGLCFDTVSHEHPLIGAYPAGHVEGIIFCGNCSKGSIARQIASQWPDKENIHVIFIDDSAKHVDSVVTELEGIIGKVTGLHYCPHKID